VGWCVFVGVGGRVRGGFRGGGCVGQLCVGEWGAAQTFLRRQPRILSDLEGPAICAPPAEERSLHTLPCSGLATGNSRIAHRGEKTLKILCTGAQTKSHCFFARGDSQDGYWTPFRKAPQKKEQCTRATESLKPEISSNDRHVVLASVCLTT